MDKLARKNKKARERIVGKRLKEQGGIVVQQPLTAYKNRGDIYPGRIAAVAWPRELRL